MNGSLKQKAPVCREGQFNHKNLSWMEIEQILYVT